MYPHPVALQSKIRNKHSMQHINIYTIEDLVKQMLQAVPVSKFAKKSSVTYNTIAINWIEKMPLAMLEAHRQTADMFGHFQVSMLTLRKQFPYRYRKDGKVCYWFDWMVKNAPLWKEISKGYKVNNLNTQLTTISALSDMTESLRFSDSDTVLQKYIEDLEAQGALLNGEAINGHEVIQVRIDFDSLSNYISSTEHDLNTTMSDAQRKTLTNNLVSAMRIYHLAVASDMIETCKLTGKNWYHIPAVIKRSEFGRVYHKGINLQSCHKSVREAALGKCIQIDINTSVFAFYKNLATKLDVAIPLALDLMLNNKDRFRTELAQETLSGMKGSKEFHISLVKGAITALGFGAKTLDNPFSVSLNKIIFDHTAREKFTSHKHVVAIVEFIEDIIEALKAIYKTDAATLDMFRDSLPAVCFDTRGAIKWKTVLAWLYQQEETDVMDAVNAAADKMGIKVLLWVHDAVYVDTVGVESKGFITEANYIATKINPQFGFERSDITQWKPAIKEHKEQLEDIAAHKALIKREELKAQMKQNA